MRRLQLIAPCFMVGAVLTGACGPLPATSFKACNDFVAAQARCHTLAPAVQNDMIDSCSQQYQGSESGCALAIEALATCLTQTSCSDLNQNVNPCTGAAGTQAVMCKPSDAAANSNTRASRGPTFHYDKMVLPPGRRGARDARPVGTWLP